MIFNDTRAQGLNITSLFKSMEKNLHGKLLNVIFFEQSTI